MLKFDLGLVTYTPDSSNVLLLSGLEDLNLAAMADAVGSTCDAGNATANNCDSRPTKPCFGTGRCGREKLVQYKLDDLEDKEDRVYDGVVNPRVKRHLGDGRVLR